MKVAKSILELIGHTPLLELNNIKKEFELKANIFAKLEFFNPAGSVKDRVAAMMIDEAEKSGLLKPGAVIIEPTSGNTGIGLAAVGASKGYRVILTMPETMSIERQNLIKSYGAEVVLTDGKKGMLGAIQRAEELADEIPDSFIPGQFENPANPLAHYLSTGPELWNDMNGNIDIFVAGVGTGGTISGTGSYLKSKKADIRVIAVEPKDAAVLSGEKAGAHGLQGIGAGFIPKTLDTTVYDEIIKVTTEEAYTFGKMMAEKEGILVGISSGAALFAAVCAAKLPENHGKNIVALLPDTGERYLSTKMFSK
ncbi:MAG: cysteine synthase A [Ruminococcaceae bacterium]|nr:cysteine synthase A [Oscillospiraceae bacterium]